MNFLLTAIEYIFDDWGKPEIVLFARSPENSAERYEIHVEGFRPYFYAPYTEVFGQEDFLLEQEAITEIEYEDTKQAFKTGDNLARIYTRQPSGVRQARDLFEKTYGADIAFTNRFLIDSGIRAGFSCRNPEGSSTKFTVTPDSIEPIEQNSELRELKPRICTFDIEVDDRADGFPDMGAERILSIVSHDSYDDETIAFIDLNGREIEDAFPNGKPDGIDEVHVQDSERKLLIEFRSWIQERDPDILTGWNSNDFDIPYVIERFNKIGGLNRDVLSPLEYVTAQRDEPKISGRVCYDLLTIYKKNSMTELDSYKLDTVAATELGEEKVEFDGGFYELYENDPATFIEYNAHDTNLTARINDEAGVIEFRDTLRREVGVSFEDSYNANDFVEMLTRRLLDSEDIVGPTGDASDAEDYEGAHVFDPYEGIAKNVVGIDLSSLYPNTMAMLNASPETKVDEDADVDSVRASNGQHFRLDQRGIFAKLVDMGLGLKSEYKEKRNSAESDEEYEKWAAKYDAAKAIVNSIYGVLGWRFFFIYDKDVAEAVTLTGQLVIQETATKARATGYEPIYGDTDSVYIKYPDDFSQDECLREARSLCEQLNTETYPTLAESIGLDESANRWKIEVEAYMERFFQAGKKKRYAYVAKWKDGREIENPSPTIKGFASKRSDSSELTEEVEERILELILSGQQEKVHDVVYEAAKEITSDNPDYDRLGIPGGMNQKINPARSEQDGYYSFHEDGYPQGAHPRAVWNANHILGTEITSSDKPKRIYIEDSYFEDVGRPINVIAFLDSRELEPIEEEISLDTHRMLTVLLTRPLERVLRAIDIDPDAAAKGQTQTGLGAF